MADIKVDVKQLEWPLVSMRNGDWGRGPERGQRTYKFLVEAMGKILCEGTLGGFYGGFELFLIEKDGRYGYIEMAYGTCNACDPIISCYGWEDLQEYVDEVIADIKWMTRDEVITDFSKPTGGSLPAYNRFRRECLAILSYAED